MVSYRWQPLEVADYHRRFPEDREIVAAALAPSLSQTVDHEPCAEGKKELPPRQLGRYEIRRVLGSGGFGVVYLAHDPALKLAFSTRTWGLAGLAPGYVVARPPARHPDHVRQISFD